MAAPVKRTVPQIARTLYVTKMTDYVQNVILASMVISVRSLVLFIAKVLVGGVTVNVLNVLRVSMAAPVIRYVLLTVRAPRVVKTMDSVEGVLRRPEAAIVIRIVLTTVGTHHVANMKNYPQL